jgi:Protein of unknown function (DUF4065)
MAWTENEDKFRELVLYISQRCATDPKFGSVKLNKILYFSDFFAYAKSGQAITAFEYQKLPNGPAPRRLLPVRARMISEGILGLQEVRLRSGKTQKRTVNLRSPDLKIFSGDEIAMVDYVIEALADADAETVSALSHRMVGWLVVSEGETIPYSTVFLSNEPLTDAEIQRGTQLASKSKASAAA